MKKTKLSTANTGGVPFQALDFQFIQDESWKGIVSTLKGLYVDYPYGFVVQGCVSTIGGATYDISEGYVYLNGDIIYFPAVTGILLATSPVYYEGTATAEARNYESGGSFTFAESKTVTTTVTSGDTITFTSTGTQRNYKDALVNQTKLKSGTWTPTPTNFANTSALSAGTGEYIRIGNIVSFSCYLPCTITSANTLTSVTFTLPISPTTNFADGAKMRGTCVFIQGTFTGTPTSGAVFSSIGTVLGSAVTYSSAFVGAGGFYCTGHYEI